MSSKPPKPLDDDEVTGNLLLQRVLLFSMIILPLIALILLYGTNLNMTIGRQLGINLPKNDQLIVYDVTCTNTAINRILHLTYWSDDSAPIAVSFEGMETPVINTAGGITSLDITLRSDTPCPPAIVVTDRSRNRHAGGSVEMIEP